MRATRIVVCWVCSLAILLCALCPAHAADRPQVIAVWPDKAPDEGSGIGPERTRMSPRLDRKQVEVTEQTRLITGVTKPTLTICRPGRDKDTGTAMVICPGGGYWDLYWQLEGEEVADWLNSIGVTGIILKYRVPRRPDEPKDEPARRPLQDAQRAVRVVRSKAKEWGISPQRIGIVGFSAGGHLAIATATSFEVRTYAPIDEIDNISCRPDFAILVYPGYLKAKDKDELAPGLRVPAGTPPVFLAHGGADIISPPENSVLMYSGTKAGRHSSGATRLCNGCPRFRCAPQRPAVLDLGSSLRELAALPGFAEAGWPTVAPPFGVPTGQADEHKLQSVHRPILVKLAIISVSRGNPANAPGVG